MIRYMIIYISTACKGRGGEPSRSRRVVGTADVWMLISSWIEPGCQANIYSEASLSAYISSVIFFKANNAAQWPLLSHLLKSISWLNSGKHNHFIRSESGLLWWFQFLCFYDRASVSWSSLSAALPYGVNPVTPVGRRGGCFLCSAHPCHMSWFWHDPDIGAKILL